MELYDNYGPSNDFCGVNLDNYFPYEQNYGAVVYIHKKFYNKYNKFALETKDNIKKREKKRKNRFFKKSNLYCSEKQASSGLNNEYVVDQTIKFAETLAPIVIPRNNDDVVYTVKASKSKRKNKKIQTEPSYEENIERRQSKRLIETFRRDFRTHNSIRESISSQSNTLDDININHSLSCTISEQSEKKYSKKEFNYKKKKNGEKIVISESFEALATEFNDHEDRKIKIHLMSEKDKNFLSDSIKTPVLNAVKECISEINNIEIREDIKYVQSFLQCNTQKLDNIMEKLSQIENYLQHAHKKQSPRLPKIPASTLEQLGEDIDEEKFGDHDTSIVTPFAPKTVYLKDNIGCGEAPIVRPTTSTGMKTDNNPSRIPARFCWTDVGRDDN